MHEPAFPILDSDDDGFSPLAALKPVPIARICLYHEEGPISKNFRIMPESTTTRKAGGLDFTAIGGKGGARSAPIVENNAVEAWILVRSMTIPLYERDGLFFRPSDGETSER